MTDHQLITLFKKYKAAEMSKRRPLSELMQALEGDAVDWERALAVTYELRDRSPAFPGGSYYGNLERAEAATMTHRELLDQFNDCSWDGPKKILAEELAERFAQQLDND